MMNALTYLHQWCFQEASTWRLTASCHRTVQARTWLTISLSHSVHEWILAASDWMAFVIIFAVLLCTTICYSTRILLRRTCILNDSCSIRHFIKIKTLVKLSRMKVYRLIISACPRVGSLQNKIVTTSSGSGKLTVTVVSYACNKDALSRPTGYLVVNIVSCMITFRDMWSIVTILEWQLCLMTALASTQNESIL